MKAFQETGLWPLNKAKIEELARINHDPANESFVPSEREEYIIQNVVSGLQKCLGEVKDEVATQSGKLRPVRVTVTKNRLYFVEDIIAEDNRKKEEEIKKKEAKEKEKEKKEIERKRKREDDKKRKEENAQLAEERQVKKAKIAEVKTKMIEMKTCKAKCMRKWRTGGDWVGCEYCDDYWVCPKCYRSSSVKKQVKKHERRCQKEK